MAKRTTQTIIAALLWDLQLGGTIEDSSGRAVKIWRERCTARGIDLLDTNLAYILREVRGLGSMEAFVRYPSYRQTRVYTIELTRDASEYAPNPYETLAEETPPAALELATPLQPVEPGADDIFDRLLMAQRLVSDALLDAICMKADLAARTVRQDEQSDDVAERLAGALEENNRLRRKLADAESTCFARSKEAEGLRRANMQLQSNLDNVMKQKVQLGDGSGFKAIDRLMREQPRVG